MIPGLHSQNSAGLASAIWAKSCIKDTKLHSFRKILFHNNIFLNHLLLIFIKIILNTGFVVIFICLFTLILRLKP